MKRLLVIFLLLMIAAPALAQDWNLPASEPTDVTKMTTREVCNNVCFVRENGGMFTCSQQCRGDDDVRLPVGFAFLTERVRLKVIPPMLEKIEFEPPNPKPGDKVSVTMTPVSKDLETQRFISTKFVYAFDSPKDWIALKPSLDPLKGVWETSFETPAGAKTLYTSARLGDAEGNTYLIAPCNVSGDLQTTEDCFFPLLDDENYEDAKYTDINPSLDLLNVKFGMDDKRYYFRMNMRGKVDPGRSSPMSANYYMIAIYAPGKMPEIDPYGHYSFILYSPYLETSNDCKMLLRRGPQWLMESGSVKCWVNDKQLLFSVARKSADINADGVFVMYAATGIIFDTYNGIITDYTGTAAVRVNKGPIELGK